MDYSGMNQLIKEGRLAEAASELDTMIETGNDDAMTWYLRGKIWWKTGNIGKAMSCYSRSVALDPKSPARHALSQARDIADFFNPDLLNP